MTARRGVDDASNLGLSLNSQAVFRFGDFELKPSAHAFTYRDAPAAIGGRAFDITKPFAEDGGAVVVLDENIRAIMSWPDWLRT